MFSCTDEYKQAFKVVKCYLTKSPILSSPKFDEELDATHGSLVLKAYQQNLYLKYYY